MIKTEVEQYVAGGKIHVKKKKEPGGVYFYLGSFYCYNCQSL